MINILWSMVHTSKDYIHILFCARAKVKVCTIHQLWSMWGQTFNESQMPRGGFHLGLAIISNCPVEVHTGQNLTDYQLSHLRPCREPNPGLRGGRRECYHSATMAPTVSSSNGSESHVHPYQ